MSLDLDVVVITDRVAAVAEAAQGRSLEVETFPPSVHLASPDSELRIQLQTDPRYQAFIPRAGKRTVLGYTFPVADVEDVLQGKLWAYQDERRRASKRQKDLADVARLVEARPELMARLPQAVRERLGYQSPKIGAQAPSCTSFSSCTRRAVPASGVTSLWQAPRPASAPTARRVLEARRRSSSAESTPRFSRISRCSSVRASLRRGAVQA